MTTRTWTTVALVAVVGIAATVLLLAGGRPGSVNVTEAAGLQEASSMEIVLPGRSDGERWITITDRDTVGRYVAWLDRPLDLEESAACDTRATLRFYITDGTVRAVEFACEDQPRLRGADGFWDGGWAAAPAELVAELETQLALIP